jgi:hypothetical protein
MVHMKSAKLQKTRALGHSLYRGRTRVRPLLHKNVRNRRAVTPAISSVILTSVIVVLLLVAMAFANNFLNARLAENEFSSMKQFMQTIGLQTDDVAWTMGRTQTTRYASQFGTLNFENYTLTYTIYVNGIQMFNHSTGILTFDMPISKYSLSNNYRERIYPSSNNHFLQVGISAPIAQVFVIEKLPMNDGNYIRVVLAPSIRMLNSTITTGTNQTSYLKFFLPVLNPGLTPRSSQSVTLEGTKILSETATGVNNIRIHVDFAKSSLGFDSNFFGFYTVDEQVNATSGSTLQLYTGEVETSLGMYA